MKIKYSLLCLLLLSLLLHCRKELPIEEPPGPRATCLDLSPNTGIPSPVSGWTIEEKSIGPKMSYNAKPYFLDEQTGFLIAANGVVWKTADAGHSWKQVFQKNTFMELQMEFIDGQRGFLSAGGSNFELYKTTDGGETWERQESTQAGVLYHFDFLNEKDVVATATIPSGTQPDSMRICRSSDGGLSWGILPHTEISFFSQNGFQMLNDSLGFFAGKEGRLYRTLDGGKTVASIKTNLKEFYDFQFLDDQNGFASDYNRFYKTTDGGSSWQSIDQHTTTLFHFSSPAEGLIVQYLDQCIDFDVISFSTGFVTTADGGTTYKTSPSSLNFFLWRWHFPTPNVGYSVWKNTLLKFVKQ